MDKCATTGEQKFHLSRITWAVVNGELIWTITDKGHKEWLDSIVDISEYDWENNVVRGYIRPENPDSEQVINIVSYMGDRFKPAKPDDKIILKLLQLIAIKYKYSVARLYSGVEVGKVGEAWKPINNYMNIENGKVIKV
jgi:hypothetical protein